MSTYGQNPWPIKLLTHFSMRDDINKLPLPKSAKRYARMTSKTLGQNWSKKVDMYLDMAADLTNQSKEGFKNKDASGKVPHAFKESAERAVAFLLGEDDADLLSKMGDVASRPYDLYQKIKAVWDKDGRNEWGPVLHSLGYDVEDSNVKCGLGYLDDTCFGNFNQGETVEVVWDDLASHLFDEKYPLIKADADTIWAIKRLFFEVFVEQEQQLDNEIEESQDDDLLSQMGNVANSPVELYRLAREALNFVFGEGQGQVAAIIAALETVGISGVIVKGGETLAELISVYLSDIEVGGEDPMQTVDEVGKLLDKYVPDLEPGSKWALLKIFKEEAGGIKDAAEEFEAEGGGMPEYWNENVNRPYHFVTSCVNCDNVPALGEMIDSAVDVTYQEFMRNVPLSAIFDSGIGYIYYWTPAQAILAGVPYEEVARNGSLTLKKDWHVSYHRSTYQGKPCFFMDHSAIEYVFVKD